MEAFWLLFLVPFLATNSLDKAESVQLFDEIFGEGWWDNDKDKEWNKLMLEQNFQHQIDRQNTQIGQIEPNSIDQNPPLTESDQLGQIEPNLTDQNPPLTESDHSDTAKNTEDERKHKTVAKELGFNFITIYAWKKELGQSKPHHPHREQKELMKRYYEIKDTNTKFSDKDIAKMLNIGRTTLIRWKKQFKRQQLHPNSVDAQFVETA
uniref:Transposase n=1 Tax=Globodera rostochiensis TaxID=31243 RepID=A0A914HPJ1_GLORO